MTSDGGPHPDADQVAQFGRLFEQFLQRVVHAAPQRGEGQLLADRVKAFLGADVASMPVVREDFELYELPTLQVALDAVLGADGVESELIGVGGDGGEHLPFAAMLQRSVHLEVQVGPVSYTTLQVSPDDEMTCVALGLFLVRDGVSRLAVLLRCGNREYGTRTGLEVVAATVDESRAFLARLRAERTARDLLRGQVLSFEPSHFDAGLGPVRFHRRPGVQRADIVLPDLVLDRVERQVAGVARHRERLLAEGRHLKRGVLLHGPPGTGKTHCVRWLTTQLTDFTVVLLTGPSISLIGTACSLARTLQPALVVLEDVDLVAQDRDFSMGMGNPLLFEVLDQLDGLASDADVAFLLTTNRADVLEPALAQRPGRVDLAVEVPLPDAEARRRLLGLYGREIELDEQQAATYLELTEGVPASFVKEVVRRATLIAAEGGAGTTTGEHLTAAAAELVEAQEQLTRHTLGGSSGELADDGVLGADGPEAGQWFVHPGPGAYGSRMTYGGDFGGPG